MNFSVTKLSESFVKPCEPTPCNNLPLSPLDKIPPLRFTLLESLQVFKYGQEPAKIIRDALSKVLAHYYPVAGEFSVSDEGELEIACTSRGVWFVEASANCRLEDFDYFDNPYVIPKSDLIPHPPPGVEDPTSVFVAMQVTKFKCDGFVVGMRSSHLMFDGVGAGQFLKAIGEMARGHNKPTLPPIWSRTQMPLKPQFLLPNPSSSSSSTLIPCALQRKIIDIPSHQITKMKNTITSINKKCSTFDVLVAKLWRSRLRAIKTNPDVLVQLAFVVNARKYLLLEEGYYGNCIYMKEVETSCDKIVNGSFSEVVELIQDAKRGIASEFSAWVDGGCKAYKNIAMSYENVIVNDWTNIRLADVDYGWGAAMSMILVEDVPVFPSCLFTNTPKLPDGVRLVTACVKEEHMEEFINQMNNFDD